MEIGTASAINLYNFQATTKSSGQSAAVLQALTQIYGDSKASAGTDPMSVVLTTANLAPVVDAMYALTSADAAASGDPGNLPANTLQAYLAYGGMNAASAATLFSTSATASGSGTLQGFDSALTASSSLALAAYRANQQYSTTQAAQASNLSAAANLLG